MELKYLLKGIIKNNNNPTIKTEFPFLKKKKKRKKVNRQLFNHLLSKKNLLIYCVTQD